MTTTKEMLEELDYLEGAAHFPHSERTDAIRALILVMGEWKKDIQRVLTDTDELRRLWELENLAYKIRDFGEEK